jgi:hypothetical protein
MKLHNLLLIGIIFAATACSKQNKCIIAGKLKNAEYGENTYLLDLRVSGDRTIDSVKVKRSGKFRYKFTIKDPGIYQLEFSSGPSLSLILMPGEKLNLSADMKDFYKTKVLIGSPNTERLNVLHDSLRNTISLLNSIRNEYNSIDSTSEGSETKKELLGKKYLDIREKYRRYSAGFIISDLHSLANIGALYQEYQEGDFVFSSTRDLQFFKLVTDSLTKYYPSMHQVKALKENYELMYSSYQTRKLLQAGDYQTFDVPELTLPNTKGSETSLSSLKGRIVLLSFWTLDDKASILNIADLKKVYIKYNKFGFEIYQVAFEKSLPRWRTSIAFEEIPWISVIDTSYPGSKTQSLFNVHSIPANYLIDKQQKVILAKNIDPETLDNSLPALLKRQE